MRRLSGKEQAKIDRAFIKAHRSDAVTQQNGYCCYCFEPITMRTATADHVLARKNGGGNGRENLVAACRPCNESKGMMTEKAFLAAIENPPPGGSIHLRLAWFRRRMWLRTHAACGRILASVGLPHYGPTKVRHHRSRRIRRTGS